MATLEKIAKSSASIGDTHVSNPFPYSRLTSRTYKSPIPSSPDSGDFHQDALRHMDALKNLAMYLTKKPSEADDLVQETYLRAFRFSHRYQTGTHLRAWLFQILRNTFFNFQRIKAREAPIGEGGIPEGTPMFQDSGDSAEILRGMGNSTDLHMDLERALKMLPENYRSNLLLTEIAGMAYDEAARILNCPVGTVKSRVFRAKGLLRCYLSAYAGNN